MQTTTADTTPIIPADRQARRVRAVVAANARRKAEGLSDLDALFIAYDAGAANEHPADDEVPTDETFVRSIAESSLPQDATDGETVWHWLPRAGGYGGVFLLCDDDSRWAAATLVAVGPPMSWREIAAVPTRGHVRRLLSALGVESAK